MFPEMKETMIKEVKEGMTAMSYQIENICKEIEIKQLSGNSGVEKYIMNKNLQRGLDSWFDMAETRITKLVDS